MDDTKYYERKTLQDAKHKMAVSKAQNRGEVAVEWFKTNKLTKETQPEFNILMKQADKDYENSH